MRETQTVRCKRCKAEAPGSDPKKIKHTPDCIVGKARQSMTAFEKWKSGSSYKHVVNPVAVAMLKATWNACTLAAEKGPVGRRPITGRLSACAQ